MKYKIGAVIIVIVIVSLIIGLHTKKEKPSVNHIIEKTDSIRTKTDSIRTKNDSIKTKINSSEIKIKYINNWYEKKFTDITNQSIAADAQFFSNYLSKDSL